MSHDISRRTFLKLLGGGLAGAAAGGALVKREDILAFLDADKAAGAAGTDLGKVTTRYYKPLGKDLSLLGFGCMRLPTTFTASGREIDKELGEKMVDFAYRHGINYFDTAWFYHDGKSEAFIGQALQKYPRDTVYLADKMPTPILTGLDQAKDIFQTQLDRCQVAYFDNYMLHSLTSQDQFDELYIQDGILDYLRQEKARGRIRCLGFSFHGDVPFFHYLLDQYDWDFCMIQLNYADWNEPGEAPSGSHQAGDLYRKCREKDVPIFVMEPVKGGNLANLSSSAEAILKQQRPEASMASWALRWVGSKEGVITMNSGMSNLEQVLDNIRTLSNFQPLSAAEERAIQRSLGKEAGSGAIPCTYCRYCEPCPYGVDIAGVFHIYNRYGEPAGIDVDHPQGASAAQEKAFLAHYQNNLERPQRASHCTACGRCLPKCPQHIDIPKHVRAIDDVVQYFGRDTGKGVV